MRIMKVLWRRGRATAREITEDLAREYPIAHSTVQTLLRGLEAKGAVDHELEGRTFVFYPTIDREEVRRSNTRDLLTRLFGGSAYRLVAHLLREDLIRPGELERVKRLLAEHEDEGEERG